MAAGRGERFGGPKQFADLDGRSVAAASVAAARSVADTVVLVVPDGYDGAGEGADLVVVGGATRVGLGARRARRSAPTPTSSSCTTPRGRWPAPTLFAAVVAAVDAGADAAVPALAVTDTLKRRRR